MKKKKIIKAQLGRIIKDNLSPQQRAQLDTYKKTVVDERLNKANQDQEDSYRKRMSVIVNDEGIIKLYCKVI